MIFPCMELFFVIFQVSHDFQSLWEPCKKEQQVVKYKVFISVVSMSILALTRENLPSGLANWPKVIKLFLCLTDFKIITAHIN